MQLFYHSLTPVEVLNPILFSMLELTAAVSHNYIYQSFVCVWEDLEGGCTKWARNWVWFGWRMSIEYCPDFCQETECKGDYTFDFPFQSDILMFRKHRKCLPLHSIICKNYYVIWVCINCHMLFVLMIFAFRNIW